MRSFLLHVLKKLSRQEHEEYQRWLENHRIARDDLIPVLAVYYKTITVLVRRAVAGETATGAVNTETVEALVLEDDDLRYNTRPLDSGIDRGEPIRFRLRYEKQFLFSSLCSGARKALLEAHVAIYKGLVVKNRFGPHSVQESELML